MQLRATRRRLAQRPGLALGRLRRGAHGCALGPWCGRRAGPAGGACWPRLTSSYFSPVSSAVALRK
jgi:hypothetical protein